MNDANKSSGVTSDYFMVEDVRVYVTTRKKADILPIAQMLHASRTLCQRIDEIRCTSLNPYSLRVTLKKAFRNYDTAWSVAQEVSAGLQRINDVHGPIKIEGFEQFSGRREPEQRPPRGIL